MKLNELDDIIVQIINSSIENGDISLLLECFVGENSYLENLDAIYSKISEDISTLSNNLPEKNSSILNCLQILLSLIQAYSISEALCLCLARTVLLLIIDENCDINNIKRAIHVFNSLLNPSIISTIVTDESLEGSLQILGRKIPSIGDYECQALLFEALYRITCNENREYWASIWFTDMKTRSMFLNLDPQKFELNCRKALNYINRNETDRRVFSFLISSVSFGSFKLKEPSGCDFWVDFNYDSQSISFYCSELCANESEENSAMWETILINSSSVKSYSVKDKPQEKLKELKLLLNYPCHILITSSNIANSAFNSHEITLSFWGILDIHQHLEIIYGKDKCMDGASSESRKISNLSVSIQVRNEALDVGSNVIVPRKKVSVSQAISVDVYECEDHVSEIEVNQKVKKVSQTSNIIRITENGTYQNSNAVQKSPANVIGQYPIHRKRKVSSSFNIKIENDNLHHMINQRTNKKGKLRRLLRKSSNLLATSSLLDTVNNDVSKYNEVKNNKATRNTPNILECDNTNNRKSPSLLVHVNNLELDSLKSNSKNVISNGHIEYNRKAPVAAQQKSEGLTGRVISGKNSEVQNQRTTNSLDIHDPFIMKDSFEQNNITSEGIIENEDQSISVPESSKISMILKQDFLVENERTIENNIPQNSFVFHKSLKLNGETPVHSERKISSLIQNSSENIVEKRLQQKRMRKKRKFSRSRKQKNLISPTSLPHDVSSNILEIEEVKSKRNMEKQRNVNCSTNKSIKRKFPISTVSFENDFYTDQNEKNYALSNDQLNTVRDSCTTEFINRNTYDEELEEVSNRKDIVFAEMQDNSSVIKNSLNEKSAHKIIVGVNCDKNKSTKRKKPSMILQQDLLNKEKIVKIDSDESHKTPKELDESPKEANDFQIVPKTQLKTVRLYNPDNAPVYDVPPFSSPSETLAKKSSLNKNNSCVTGESVVNNSENILNISKLKEKGRTEAGNHINRKRTLNEAEDIDKRIAQDKNIVKYDVFQSSDDDFEEHSNRTNWERKQYNKGDTSTYKQSSSQKRKYEALQSNTIKTTESTRTPRRAALTAIRENKRILNSSGEVEYDKIEVLDELGHCPKNSTKTSEKKRSKVYTSVQTDTETCSDVSWFNPDKSCFLFETPKKSYTEWRKSNQKKRKLPVKIVSNLKTFVKKSPPKRSKRIVRNIQSSHSGIKPKNDGWSELKKFNLTVEKITKRSSYSMIKDLESDFQSMSTSSQKKSLQPSSKPGTSEQDLSIRNECIQENNTLNENVDCNNGIGSFQIDNTESKHTDKKTSRSSVHSHISENKSISKKKLNVINIQTNSIKIGKQCSNSNAPVILADEHEKLINRKKRSEYKKVIHSDNELASSEILANGDLVHFHTDFEEEAKGKQFILERFLESVAENSESCKSSAILTNQETGSSNMDLNPPHFSNESFVNGTDSSKCSIKRKSDSNLDSDASKKKEESIIVYYDENAEKETEYAFNNAINLQDQRKAIIQGIRKEIRKPRKVEDCVSSPKSNISFTKAKKRSATDDLNEVQNFSAEHKHSKNSKRFKKDAIDALSSKIILAESFKNMDMHDSIDEANRMKLKLSSEQLQESERSRKKYKQKKFKDISDSSFNSLHSKVASISSQKNEYDKEWFDKITFVLSQDANNLTRKLLATVQKCFCEYSAKMNVLRENVVNTIEAFETLSSPNTMPQDLKSIIKNCKTLRNEVEKSLKQMYVMGKEYFEAEGRFHRKLKQKHIKAGRKFILSMQKSEKTAAQKLEHNILLKAKRFLRSFVKHIDSA